jgi:hypothetical protein
MRHCQMPVRMFDGFVKIKKSEVIELDEVSTETREFHRRVLSKETIKAAGAFRSEISRAVGQIGFKVAPLGVLVEYKGLEALKALERDAKQRAGEILQLMLDDLINGGESETLARCEVDLIALRLHPEEEFAEQVEMMIAEAFTTRFDEESSSLNKTLEETLNSLKVGHALVAQKKLSMVGRFLSEMAESQGDNTDLALAREELAVAKSIIADRQLIVDDKISRLKTLKLFEGVKISVKVAVKAAGGK